jgi:hypothetical protein
MKKLIFLAWHFSFLAALMPVVAAHAMPPSSSATDKGNPEGGTPSAVAFAINSSGWTAACLRPRTVQGARV